MCRSLTLITFIDRGQGLNHALDDVDKLVKQFVRIKEGTATLEEAIHAYETEVWERGEKAVQGSLEDAKAILKIKTEEALNSRLAKQGVKNIEAE